jgi:hypothetical protein
LPTITYMSWNIQNLGQNTEMSNAARGTNAAQFADFLAAMVVEKDIDIVGVMEVRPGSNAYLDSILTALDNADPLYAWYYDYIKSTVAVPLGTAVNSNAELGWASGARTEGYAIFWRTIPGFAMQGAATNTSEGTIHFGGNPPLAFGSCLSLSQEGRLLAGGGFVRAAAGYDPLIPAGGNWGPSLYPSAQKSLSANPRWQGSRRPATCTIQLTTGANPPCTISIFHSPSKQPRAWYGTYIAGLAKELYAVPNGGGGLTALTDTIASGDYNTSATNYWDTYDSFYANFGNTGGDGANCNETYDNATAIPTTVQLNTWQAGTFTGPAIAGATPDDYYFSSIDNIFWRSTGADEAVVWGLIESCEAGGSMTGAPIQAYHGYLQGLVAAATLAGYGLTAGCPNDSAGNPLFPNITNWANFLTDVFNGTFTSSRRAAEFVRIFLSDHLPLRLELTYP